MERMHVTEQPTSRCYRVGHVIFNHYCTYLKGTCPSLISMLRKGYLVLNVCSSDYKRSQVSMGSF